MLRMVGLGLGVWMLVACSGRGPDERQLDATPSPSVADDRESPTVPSTTVTPTPVPPGPFPPGTSVGIATLDALIDAITSSDLDLIQARAGFLQEECLDFPTQGAPAHVCERDEAVGTPIELFSVQTCATGGWFVRREEVRGVLRPLAEGRHRLIGVVELPPDRPSKRVIPVKEPAYVIVFASHSDPPGATLVISNPRGEFSTVHYECFGFTPHEALESWRGTYPGNRQIFP